MVRSMYIHIPFCRKICSYCDFTKIIYNEKYVMPYLEKFHEMYPKIEIQIVNSLTTNLLKELRNGNLDILF